MEVLIRKYDCEHIPDISDAQEIVLNPFAFTRRYPLLFRTV